MIKYLCKPIRDNDGLITGYTVGPKISLGIKPKGDYEILFGDDFSFVKAEKDQNNQWIVVEDSTKKALEKTKSDGLKARKSVLEGALSDFDTKTVAEKLGIMKKLLEHLIDKGDL